VFSNIPDLLFDEVVIIEQPLGGGRNCAAFARGCGDHPIGREQNRLVVPQSRVKSPAGRMAPRDLLCDGETRCVLLETLDAE
jgi:hypothetical protein